MNLKRHSISTGYLILQKILQENFFFIKLANEANRLFSSIRIMAKTFSELLDLPSNGRSNPEVVGSIPTEVIRIFSLPRVVP